MDLLNPTVEPMSGRYDGSEYVIPANSEVHVPDAAGEHLLSSLHVSGLCQLRYSRDPGYRDKVALDGIRRRVAWHSKNLEDHETTNQRHREMHYPPLVESEAVKAAKTYLPVYEKLVKVAGGNIEEQEVQEKRKAAEALLGMRPASAPRPLEKLDRAKLLEMARELKLEPDEKWSTRQLIEAVQKAGAAGPQEAKASL